MILTNSQQLAEICSAPLETANLYFDSINNALAKFEVNSFLRIAHFMAQIGHESGSLRYSEEIASGAQYEGRKDLGNTLVGDGIKFKGRGLIQITGRGNYTLYGKSVGVDFTENPSLLSSPEFASDSASWFWSGHKLNELADADDLIHITRRINGGLNGLQDRSHRLQVAKRILGIQ